MHTFSTKQAEEKKRKKEEKKWASEWVTFEFEGALGERRWRESPKEHHLLPPMPNISLSPYSSFPANTVLKVLIAGCPVRLGLYFEVAKVCVFALMVFRVQWISGRVGSGQEHCSRWLLALSVWDTYTQERAKEKHFLVGPAGKNNRNWKNNRSCIIIKPLWWSTPFPLRVSSNSFVLVRIWVYASLQRRVPCGSRLHRLRWIQVSLLFPALSI